MGEWFTNKTWGFTQDIEMRHGWNDETHHDVKKTDSIIERESIFLAIHGMIIPVYIRILQYCIHGKIDSKPLEWVLVLSTYVSVMRCQVAVENHRNTIGKWWFSMGFLGTYSLVMTNKKLLNIAIYTLCILSFPINSMVIFHCHVWLPEGIADLGWFQL